MKLDQINLDDVVTILSVDKAASIKRRLFDLGFIPGEEVKCVLMSPAHNPVAYEINGSVIALRGVDAHHIEVAYERN